MRDCKSRKHEERGLFPSDFLQILSYFILDDDETWWEYTMSRNPFKLPKRFDDILRNFLSIFKTYFSVMETISDTKPKLLNILLFGPRTLEHNKGHLKQFLPIVYPYQVSLSSDLK